MLRMINLVEQENGESWLQSRFKSYPCGSAPVWKLLAKVPGLRRGECSQRGAAMRRDEGACQHDSGEWRFGLTVARTSALTVKRERLSFGTLPASLMRLPWQANRVQRAATWRKRLHLQTIELPRRSRFGGITAAYKATPKRPRYALAHGTNFLRPVLQGTQQDQSSRLPEPGRLAFCSSRCPRKVLPQATASRPFGRWEQLAGQLKPHSAQGVPLRASTCPQAKQHSPSRPGLRGWLWSTDNRIK
jgi:hypothetical protein